MTTYLVLADLPTALARSQQQATALGCDGVHTIWWWAVQPLKDGTAALIVADAGDFAATTSNAKKSGGLTVPEQSTLKTPAQIATLIPAVAIPG